MKPIRAIPVTPVRSFLPTEDQILKRGLLMSSFNFSVFKYHCNFLESALFISCAHTRNHFPSAGRLAGGPEKLVGPNISAEAGCHSVHDIAECHESLGVCQP